MAYSINFYYNKIQNIKNIETNHNYIIGVILKFFMLFCIILYAIAELLRH